MPVKGAAATLPPWARRPARWGRRGRARTAAPPSGHGRRVSALGVPDVPPALRRPHGGGAGRRRGGGGGGGRGRAAAPPPPAAAAVPDRRRRRPRGGRPP